MRYADRLTFVKKTESYYDPAQGEYVEGEEVRTVKPCKLSPMKIDRKRELFGDVDTRITVARLQQPYAQSFDHIEINNKIMQLKHRSDYRRGVFYLEGDF